MRPRTILMTSDAQGGVYTYALTLCRALIAQRVHVVLAMFGKPVGHSHWETLETLPNVTLAEGGSPFDWEPGQSIDLAASRAWLAELAVRYQVDLIHANSFLYADLPVDRPVVQVVHAEATGWWEAVNGRLPPGAWDEYRAIIARALGAAAVIIVPNHATLSSLRRSYGALPDARVIRHGIQLGGRPRATKQPLVLGAGRVWDEAKNLVALDRAAPRIAWHVTIAGSLDHPSGRVVSLRHARTLGQTSPDRLSHLMAEAMIFVHPARYEPFGLVILEAAASGCALVLGDIASLHEIWGDAALYVPPDDDAALAAAVNRLINDAALRRLLVGQAQRIAAQHSHTAMAAAYFSLYAGLIQNRAESFG